MIWKDILNREIDALTAELAARGGEFERAAQEIREYAAERALLLSEATGDAGFADAARAEAVNVAGFAALKAVEQADALDAVARDAFVSGMTTALRIVAGFLAAA